ncbi:MAG TPA: fibronectin type III domain-containing protein [Polyangiaceae bacterium]|nr:fibronectin type III domain-containing protein [Polyangiaceae bacterium]
MKTTVLHTCLSLLGASIVACSASRSEPQTDRSPGSSPGNVRLELNGTDVTPSTVDDTWNLAGSTPGWVGIDKLIDNDHTTYLWVGGGTDQITYQLARPTVITSYDIVAASESSGSPKDWRFEATQNGFDWMPLDTQTGQSFAPGTARTFALQSASPYIGVRLVITASNVTADDGALRIAEFRVGGTLPSGVVPGAPTLQAVVDSTSARLSFSATNATGYVLRRYSLDGGAKEISVSSSPYTDPDLIPGTPYVYTVQAVNGNVRGFPNTALARVVPPVPPTALKDVTALFSDPPRAQYDLAPWVVGNVTDGHMSSKWYAGSNATSWLEQSANADTVVTQYTLTSANDYPDRDPKTWELQGSVDGKQWTVLDRRQNQFFTGRLQTRRFTANTQRLAFPLYRLAIVANHGAPDLQLTEWRLFGTTSATLAPPATPTGLAANALSSDQIQLTFDRRTSRQNPETSLVVQRATDANFTQNVVERTAGPARDADAGPVFDYRALNLAPATEYFFRVKAVNAAGSSAYTSTRSAKTANASAPASFVTGNWYPKANEQLDKVYSDANIVVYRDSKVTDVPDANAIAWLTPALSEAWAYIKANYPVFSGPQLQVILGNQKGSASVTYAYSSQNAYRNAIFSFSDKWSLADRHAWKFESLMHEMNHIVESNNNEMQNSPSYSAWGDSRWGEIFMYDLFSHLASVPATGVEATHAQTLLDSWWEARDGVGAHWLQGWYYPLYTGALGNNAPANRGVAFLNKYFSLLAQYYPKFTNEYARTMNLGEYIHFCSAAAGLDLTTVARSVFRFDRRPEVEAQLAQAQLDFPDVYALYGSNRAPGFTLDPIPVSGAAGSPLTGQTLAERAGDPDLGATLTYSKQSGPTWLSVAADGSITGTPPTAGTYAAEVRVTDNGGLFDTATLTVVVSGGACTPETDAAFCSRLSAACGALTGTDNCGAARSVASCGSCNSPLTCGGAGVANACGSTGGTGPCSGLCTNPIVIPSAGFGSGALGTAATCHESKANLIGSNCSNFTARTFRINSALATCNGQPIPLPAKRNGGYCFQASAGEPAWATFSTY